jgi:alkylated DNA repair dioxygenase AlkB
METLFPPTVDLVDVPAIPGLRYLREYITEAEEQKLAQAIDRLPWDTRWQRRIQPYGGMYGEEGSAPPIPAWGRRLARRMLEDGITDMAFDQMLVNEYLPGQGIALHRDYASYDRTVASLSLLSAYVMDFRHHATGRKENLLLERRSLLILTDEARLDWQHGLAHRKTDRWHGMALPRGRRLSVTFRTLKK